MASVFRELVIDSSDPARLAAFWSDVLGWNAVRDEDGDYWMSSSGAPDGRGPILVFVKFPRHDEELRLLASYRAEDTGTSG